MRNATIEIEVVSLIPALNRFARRFHRAGHDADDLVQETLSKAVANLDKFQEGTRLKSWLFTIMRNTFMTRYGKNRREQVSISDEMMQMTSMPATQEWTMRGHEMEIALAELPPRYRDAIHMIAIEGASYEEAAARSACPVGTIKSRVNRARQQLSVRLDS